MQFVSPYVITRPFCGLSRDQHALIFRHMMYACETFKVDAFCIPSSDAVNRYELGNAISYFFGRRIVIFNHKSDGLYFLSYEGCFPSPDFVFVTDYERATKISQRYAEYKRSGALFDIFSC